MSGSQKRIKQIIAATGDWFQLQVESLPEGRERIVMSRVTTWAVVMDEGAELSTNESVAGIDTGGYFMDDDYLRFSYVCGRDVAPNGKTWFSIFNETPSFDWGLKDISEVKFRD